MVRVLKRQEAGHIPFDEVQDKIRNKLQETRISKTKIGKLIEDLWANATIDTPYEIQGYERPGS